MSSPARLPAAAGSRFMTSEVTVNEDELIHRIAHRIDPLVFDHEGPQPPSSFFGSPEWWATAKHSRRKRAIEAAAAAVEAIRALGLAVVPREATAAMARAGAERLAAPGGDGGAVSAFPTVVRRGR